MRLAASLALVWTTMAATTAAAQTSPESSTTTTPESTSTPTSTAAGKPKANQRILCGCASSRFLEKGPAVVDLAHPIVAWLHGGATLSTFTRAANSPQLTPAPLPFLIEPIYAGGDSGAGQIVRVSATGDGSGYLGISRPGEKSPRDVLAATAAASSSMAPSPPPPPHVKALWLGPAESRERKGCGTFVTQRVHWELAEGSADIAALVVKDVDSGRVTVVDARHAGAFGIGHVDVCDHGAEVKTGPQRFEITPLSTALTLGGVWGFSHDGSGTTDPTRTAVPADADADLADTGFPTPVGPEKPISFLSVGGVWIGIGVGIGVFGVLGYVLWRLKRRRLENVVCASCGSNIPVDVLDEKVDGFFCPACGTAGVWKKRGSTDVTSSRFAAESPR